MIRIRKAPDRKTNSQNREFLCNNLPKNIRVNGYPVGKWEFELQKIEDGEFPTVGSVSTDLKRIKISVEPDKSIPKWVIKLATEIVKKNKSAVEIFLE